MDDTETRESLASWIENGFEAVTVQPLAKLKELEEFDIFFDEDSGTLKWREFERTLLLLTPEQVREHGQKYHLKDAKSADWRGIVGHELAEGLARLVKADDLLDNYISGNEITRFGVSLQALRGELAPPVEEEEDQPLVPEAAESD
jgi:hypothetical protein